MGSSWQLTVDAARWALRCYAGHWPLVLGLSLVPSLQRFVSIRYGEHLPAAVGVAGELLTAAARVALVWLVLRIIVSEAGLAGLGIGRRWQLLGQGVDARMRDFLLQFVVLGVAFVLLDVIPEGAVRLWVPQERQALVNAIMLAVKNPTVIAMTMLWMIGVGRVLMTVPQPASP